MHRSLALPQMLPLQQAIRRVIPLLLVLFDVIDNLHSQTSPLTAATPISHWPHSHSVHLSQAQMQDAPTTNTSPPTSVSCSHHAHKRADIPATHQRLHTSAERHYHPTNVVNVSNMPVQSKVYLDSPSRVLKTTMITPD